MPYYKTKNKKDGLQGYFVKVNYTDRNGNYKSKTKTVYGLDEAKRAERELTLIASQGEADKSLSVQDLYTLYIESKKADVRQSSLEKNMSVIKNHIIPSLGDTKLDKLTPAMMQKWKNEINEKKLSIRMKQNIYSVFNALLNFGINLDYLITNPLAKVGNFREAYFEKPQDKLKYYTAEEFKKYIAVAKSYATDVKGWQYYVFFNIAFYTGARKGEINGLKWGDIEGNILHIRRSVAQKLKGISFMETPPKNKSSYRDLQLPAPLVFILSEYKEMLKAKGLISDDFEAEMHICGGAGVLPDTEISNRNNQYADEAKLPRIRIHDFRHTHATLLVNEGINIQEVARRLGHSKIEITWNTYSHLYPREEDRALEILNKIA